ncbi:MAG: nucleoside-triphosphatase, partial [Candidatus Methylomirabilaceae bacterium]
RLDFPLHRLMLTGAPAASKATEETVKAKNVLVTGRPGIGKTTLLEHVVASLRGKLRLGGFTTGEILDPAGRRLGFLVTTLDGRQAELARVGVPSRHRVGRYGVNLEAFERLALPELGRRDVDLLVIDEIGTMECGSGRFRRAVEDALDAVVPILATVGRTSSPFVDALWERPDVERLTLTERNREALGAELCARWRGA